MCYARSMKRTSRKSGNNRRSQQSKRERDAMRIAKVADPAWGQAVLDQGARNNTVPAKRGKGSYRRPSPGQEW